MVAVASPLSVERRSGSRGLGWTFAAGLVLVTGLVGRMAISGGGIGDRSATLLGFLLTLCAYLATRVVGGQRLALVVTAVCVVVFDLAGLPARSIVEYDDVQAFYRTDQVLSAPVALDGQGALTMVAQPVFVGPQASFGLEAEVNGAQIRWTCAFERGVQRLVLPLPAGISGSEVQLHLTGSPNRESDYLLVYQSSRRGGFVIDAGPPAAAATSCALA